MRWSVRRFCGKLYVRIFSSRPPEPMRLRRAAEYFSASSRFWLQRAWRAGFSCLFLGFSSGCVLPRTGHKRPWVCAISERRIPFVHMLASGSAGTAYFDAEIFRADFYVHFLRFRHDGHGGGGSMDAPCVSVAGTRCTRCTPPSYFRNRNTSSPAMRQTTSLNPPTSDGLLSRCSKRQPRSSAKRWYIRSRSPANRRLHPRPFQRGFQ